MKRVILAVAVLACGELAALVHFADGQTQQWLIVRLEEPAASEAQPPAGSQP